MRFNMMVFTFLLVSSIALSFSLFILPDYIPFSWNWAGQVELYLPKIHLIWTGALPLILYLAVYFFYHRENPLYGLVTHRTAIFLVLLNVNIVVFSLNLSPSALLIFKLTMGVFFFTVARMASRLKKTNPLALRNPWTLESPEIWDVVHRHMGFLYFCLALLSFLLVFAPIYVDLWLLVSAILLVNGFLHFHSHQLHKKNTANK